MTSLFSLSFTGTDRNLPTYQMASLITIQWKNNFMSQSIFRRDKQEFAVQLKAVTDCNKTNQHHHVHSLSSCILSPHSPHISLSARKTHTDTTALPRHQKIKTAGKSGRVTSTVPSYSTAGVSPRPGLHENEVVEPLLPESGLNAPTSLAAGAGWQLGSRGRLCLQNLTQAAVAGLWWQEHVWNWNTVSR